MNTQCNEAVKISFNAHLSGGQTACVDFGADGFLTSLSVDLDFSGSVEGEKASDFGVVVYSTHYHSGIQVGGYDYYMQSVRYISGWPEQFNSRLAGNYSSTQQITITPPFDVDGDYYRCCIFNGWSAAQTVSYAGLIQLDQLSLNCDVIPPDLTPTVSPTPQPTVTLAPTSLTERGIYSISLGPLEPLIFRFDVNLSSAAFVCSSPTEAIGDLSNLTTVFDFYHENEFSWASDLLVTIRVTSGEEGFSCGTVGGLDVDPQSTCQSPIFQYLWPSALQQSDIGNYKATMSLIGWNSPPSTAFYEVCVTNGFNYNDGTTATYRGELSLVGLTVPSTSAPSTSPTATDKKSNEDDDSEALSSKTVLLLSIIIPVGVVVLLIVGYLVLRMTRKSDQSPLLENNRS